MLVGVISDTHSFMDPRALALLQGVDCILHAGDIGDDAVIRKLEQIAPVTAVRGNVDRDGPVSHYPSEQTLELVGHRIFLTHELKPPKNETDASLVWYKNSAVDIAVFGHSHIVHQKSWNDILFFNPGAAGKRRFKVIPSVGFLTLGPNKVSATVAVL